jgi:hypothetical protein
MDEGSSPPWVPLLRRLTQLSPHWGVYKNVDSALTGRGDIDSISDPADRDLLIEEFTLWSTRNGLSPVFRCPHLPGSVLAVALRDRRDLVELQLSEWVFFRGAALFEAADVSALMVIDDRGFRRLRPGMEGLLLLLINGTKLGGRPNYPGIHSKRVVELLRVDPEGVHASRGLFGSAWSAVSRLVKAVLDGGWDRRSALVVEAWASARALRSPQLLGARALLRLTGGKSCPLLPILRRGRRLDGDVEAWLSAVKRGHEWIENN